MDRSAYYYLRPTPEQDQQMLELRDVAAAYGAALDRLPEGPDKEFCIRNHRTTAMWALVALKPDGSPRT